MAARFWQFDSSANRAFVYVAYADDASGSGFTLTFSAGKNYIAIKSSTTAIASPAVGDFTGLWTKYRGSDGVNGTNGTNGIDGINTYLYIGYADDASGTNYSTTPTGTSVFIAFRSDNTVVIPDAAYFAGLWKKYSM